MAFHMPHNLEWHPTRRGELIGYARGPWRVIKCLGQWRATKKDSLEGFGAHTLAGISLGLTRYEESGKVPPPVTVPLRLHRAKAARGHGAGC